jgi:hypothetical protein
VPHGARRDAKLCRSLLTSEAVNRNEQKCISLTLWQSHQRWGEGLTQCQVISHLLLPSMLACEEALSSWLLLFQILKRHHSGQLFPRSEHVKAAVPADSDQPSAQGSLTLILVQALERFAECHGDSLLRLFRVSKQPSRFLPKELMVSMDDELERRLVTLSPDSRDKLEVIHQCD